MIKNIYSRIINSYLKFYDISNGWVKFAVVSSIENMNPYIRDQ